jgi:hypothetical protein
MQIILVSPRCRVAIITIGIGTTYTCTDMKAWEYLDEFTSWARLNGKRAFLGEWAGGPDQVLQFSPQCPDFR